MASNSSSSKGKQTTPKKSPLKKTLLLHVLISDNYGTHVAFDSQGALFCLKTNNETHLPHGEIATQTTYKIKGFVQEGKVLRLGKNATISIYPTEFPAKKVTKVFTMTTTTTTIMTTTTTATTTTTMTTTTAN